jgi:hypothetical protein
VYLASKDSSAAAADGVKSNEPPTKSSPSERKPSTKDWKVATLCTLTSYGAAGGESINVTALLKGRDTVTSCGGFKADSCKVGQVSEYRRYLMLRCEANRQYRQDWQCSGVMLDVDDMEERQIGMLSLQTIEPAPKVKSFNPRGGEAVIGPIYGGVDLTMSGMTTDEEGEFTFGGRLDIVGIGGAMMKSKIELSGTCP